MPLRFALALLLAWPAMAGAGDFPAGSACALLGAGDLFAEFDRLQAMSLPALAGLVGQPFAVRVNDPDADRYETVPLPEGRRRLAYRMDRNHVTEGWNWHPEADPSREDYYRYKFLPLGVRETETAPPRQAYDPAIRMEYTVRYVRRDAYYFAFDNPHGFYPRGDDEAGFSIDVSEPAAEFVLVARGRYVPPVRAESGTYWRALPSQPVDLWLKNRYIIGRLEALWFCAPDGRVLGHVGE